jgi:hypothetical protein
MMDVEKLYHFEDWLIVKNLPEKKFFFVVDPYGFTFFYVDKIKYDIYDQCFRAARKWMRDNQNLVYGET